MFDATELRKKSREELLKLIEAERQRAATELRQIERSAGHLIGNSQQLISHPFQAINEIVEPRSAIIRHPLRWTGLAFVAGVLCSLALRPRKRSDTPSRQPSGSQPAPQHALRRGIEELLYAQMLSFARSALSGGLEKLRGTILDKYSARPTSSWTNGHAPQSSQGEAHY